MNFTMVFQEMLVTGAKRFLKRSRRGHRRSASWLK